jgi:F-type H+-transporting ATPase subunit gamma
MTRRRDVERRLRSLEEIRNILDAIKSLAYMETRKLTRRLVSQHRVVETAERMAADFLAFHPYTLPGATLPTIYLVIGSERGLCGDFNDQVHRSLERHLDAVGNKPSVIAVGAQLNTKLAGEPRLAAAIEGADVAEEAERVLIQIVEAIDALRSQYGPHGLTALYQDTDSGGATVESLLPPFRDYAGARPAFPFPPLLNLEPTDFLLGLVDQYLPAALHEVLYASLMAENRRRVQHLEGAVRHLDERIETLQRKSKRLRQEEIIEEIEVILLGATHLQPHGGRPSSPASQKKS